MFSYYNLGNLSFQRLTFPLTEFPVNMSEFPVTDLPVSELSELPISFNMLNEQNPHPSLLMKGLNNSAAQSLSYEYIFLKYAWCTTVTMDLWEV
jgi:hypothetical protein